MQFPDSFFEDEVRDGFFIPTLMKRAWAAQLEVLEEISRICEKYHIRWFADWGSLLGAVRHGGYIPWDDDLDICMLRDDYILFNAVAEKELPEGYFIPRKRAPEYRTFTTVWNKATICLDEMHIKKFHGFPYPAGVDIFVLDHIAPNPEDEEFRSSLAVVVANAAVSVNDTNQHTAESEELISEVENLLQVSIDRNQPVQEQLFVVLENLFSLYMHETATDVASMSDWILDRAWKFPMACYEASVNIPFEGTEIAVPVLYQNALKIQFGEHYMTPYRAGGGHDYPCYQRFDSDMRLLLGEYYSLFQYHISGERLKHERKPLDNNPRKTTRDFFHLARKIHIQILASIDSRDPYTGRKLLAACQNAAIQVGTLLEQYRGENLATVRLLEEYCELIWQIHVCLDNAQFSAALTTAGDLDTLLSRLSDLAEEEILSRKEIVFFPFRSSAWSGLESLWQKAKADPACDVYVVPIPYYYRNLDGTLRDMQYEGNLFPDYVSATDYESYDFENRQPDVILIQNPYDEYNITTSVDPRFYASNLRQYTELLVYRPYLVPEDFGPEDTRAVKNMKYYVSMPGVVLADRILVQSEQMEQMYIDHLAKFAGEETRNIWEQSVTVL